MTRPISLALAAASLWLAGCGSAPQAPTAAAMQRTASAVRASADFPAIGHVYRVNFGGGHAFNLSFASSTQLTYSAVAGGGGETVAIAVTPIRPGVFMVTWQESDRTTVVHVEDYQNGLVYTNITPPDGSFIHWHGTLELVK